MSIHLTINGIEVTKYLVASIPPVLDDSLNQSKILTFSVYPADQNLSVPLSGQRVRLFSDNQVIHTGYITVTPILQLITPGIVGYNVEVESDEWIFNTKQYGQTADFVAQNAGNILIELVTLVGGISHANTTNITPGPFLPRFSIVPTWTFTEAAKTLCDAVGYRWYMLDGVLYFVSQNDVPYNNDIDSSKHGFNINSLVIQSNQIAITNDATAIGFAEPKVFVQDNVCGDGKLNSVALTESFNGAINTELLFKDSFLSSVLNPTVWTVNDPLSAINYQPNNLTIKGGTQNYGQTVIYLNNAFELGGELVFDAGKFTFADLSTGIIGGIYSNKTFTKQSCIAGFTCLGNTVRAGIQALVQGQPVGSVITTDKNHSYELEVFISADDTYRYNQLFQSIYGQFGGTTSLCDGYATFVVTTSSLVDPSEAVTETVIYDGQLKNISPFGYYGLINSLGMFISTTGVPSVNTLPPVRVRSSIVGRIINASIAQNLNSNWIVTLPYTPAAAEFVSVTYRTVGIPQARLINPTSIASIGDKAVTLAIPSTVRTSIDCENLLQAFLSDYSTQLYGGTYTTNPATLETIPVSGRYVSVNVNSIPAFVSIVTDVKLTITDALEETVTIYTVFGFASRITPYNSTSVQGTITAQNLSSVPSSLPDISSVDNNTITGSSINIDAGRAPVYGFEVRSTDSGWGTGNTSNYIGQFFTETFSLNRTNESDKFYIREFDHGMVPFYSRDSVLIEATGVPITPLPPVITISSTSDLNAVLNLTVENRNDITQEILEIASDSGFTDIVFTDSRTTQFSTSSINLNTGGTYYARARKEDVLGFGPNTVSPPSFTLAPLVDPGIPTAPSNLTISNQAIVTAADGTITISLTFTWTVSSTSTVTGYRIRWTKNSGGPYTFLVTDNVATATIHGLLSNQVYYFSIAAVGQIGQLSGYTSDLVYTTSIPNAPSTPTGLTTTNGFRLVGLAWNANPEKNIASYSVQWCATQFGTYTEIANVSVDYYIDQGDSTRGQLAITTSYWYKIAAINTNGVKSSYTAAVSATTLPINSQDINVAGISVGGGTSMPGVFTVYDNSSNVIGYVGQFNSTILGGTAFGGWFKTLGVGGTKDAPGLLADSSGNVSLLTGTIKNGSGVSLITAGTTNIFSSTTLSGTVTYTPTTGFDNVNGFVDYWIKLTSIAVSGGLPADFQYWYILANSPDGYFKPYYINTTTPKLSGLLENTLYTLNVYAVDKLGRMTAATTQTITTPSAGKITGSTCLLKQGSIVISNPPNWNVSSTFVSGQPSISLSIPQNFPLYFSDASVLILTGGVTGGGLQTFTWQSIGLAFSTTYYFYPFVDIGTGIIHFAGGGTPSIGPYPANLDPPSVPLTTPSVFASMNCFLDGRAGVSVSQINATTVNSGGTGGGGGGGGNSCVEENTILDIQGRGNVKAITVKAGEFIKGRNIKTGKDVYRRINWVFVETQSHWKSIKGVMLTLFEPVWIDSRWEFAFKVPGAEDVRRQSQKVKINVDLLPDETYDDHNFYAGELLIHNTFPIGS